MTFSLMYMFGLLELLTCTKSGEALRSGQAEQEESVLSVPQSKHQSASALVLNQVSDKAPEANCSTTVASKIDKKVSNSTLFQSLTEQKDHRISAEFTRKLNLPPTTHDRQRLEVMTYPKRNLWVGEVKYWRWRIKTPIFRNVEGSRGHVDSSGSNDRVGERVRSKRAAKRIRRRERDRIKTSQREQSSDEKSQDGNYFSRDLLKSYLDDGYKVRVYSSDSYDVIFRKDKQNKQNKKKHKQHLLRPPERNQKLSDTFDDSDQRRRYRRHLSQDGQIKTSSESRQIIIVKRQGSLLLSCTSNPCKNGATCLVEENSKRVVCKCLPHFAGDRCETPLHKCLSLPCQNDATCIDHGDGFECFCQPGFFGTFCENDINECASVPCLNGGRCHDLVNGYRCSCGRKFEGKNCENRRTSKWFQICESNVCLNGGVCVMRNEVVQCTCTKAFTGSRCEISLLSAQKGSTVTELYTKTPCLNGGVYEVVDMTKSVCKCRALFTGETCAIRSKPCASHRCAANEVCVEDESSFTSSYLCKPVSGNSVPGYPQAGYSMGNKQEGFLIVIQNDSSVPGRPKAGYSMGNNEGYLIGNKNETVIIETVTNYNVVRVVAIIVASLLLLAAICYILCLFIYYNPYGDDSHTEVKSTYQSSHDYKRLSTAPTNPSSDRQPEVSSNSGNNNNVIISAHRQVRSLNNNSWKG